MTVLLAAALAASACSGGATTLTEDSLGTARTAATPVPSPAAEEDAAPTPQFEPTVTQVAEPSPTAPPVVEPGGSGWADDLDIGLCFNNIAEEGDGDLAGPAVDCSGEHEYEIYFMGETADAPDAPFPTDVSFTDGLFETACDPALIDFAGGSFDRVPFGTAVWTPPAAYWAAGDRTFACVAEAGLRSENLYKVGTAGGGTLTTDDGIVSRATVQGQRDFFFSFQGSTLYPLTNGKFELPNISPTVLSSGLLFASPLQDVDLPGTVPYDFAFANGETTQLETGLDGWEIASPHLVFSVPAFMFAAREDENDDWDLYLSRTPDDIVALTDNDVDDRWPTMTPDQTQIVYHSDGNIWIMDVDGNNQQQLTSEAANDFESAVSPDGSQVVFASDRSGNDDIWLMNIDGSNPRNLTEHPADEAWPFFSGDGRLIYFQTDRLGVQSNIMVMETDGSNQSYFSFEFMTNGALLPPDVTERFAAELPTISEVLENTVSGVVAGLAGAVAEVDHSSGRLTADLPVGWEFEEVAGPGVGLLAAPSIAAYRTSWAADGISIAVVDTASDADFRLLADQAAATTDSSCAPGDDSEDDAGGRLTLERRYTCGAANTAVVIATYDRDSGVALVVEAQWDRNPSDAADEAFITAIATSLDWG